MKTHEKLAQMRKDAKLSRRELADISGFNEHTILAYERNQNPASYEYLEFCSLYFGYTQSSITAILYFAKETKNTSYPPLEKMSEQEQILKIYQKITGLSNRNLYEMLLSIDQEILTIYKEFKELQPTYNPIADELLASNVLEEYISKLDKKEFGSFLEFHNIDPADYTPSKYAEFVRLENTAKKLEKSKQYSKQDLELLALLNSLDAEVKDGLKALIKTIIAKGGKM